MKKSILIVAFGLALFSSAFAGRPSTYTDRAAAAFRTDFIRASNVQWSEKGNYVVAKFVQDQETLFAYYDFHGNLMGVVHHILTTSLPENLQSDIKKGFPNFWVSELFQVSSENGDYYYIQLKNADETIVLSTEGTNGWHRYFVPNEKCSDL